MLGIRAFESEAAKSRFSNAVHWSYGTAWGAVRALLGERLSPVAASAAHLAALWGSEQVMLPVLGVAPPLPEWGAGELAIDGAHHAVYAAATGTGYELPSSRL